MKKIRLTSICSPKQWKTIPTKDLLDEGYPVYGANGVIGYCKEYNHTSDTIIIGCRGSCGNVNIARGKSYINGNAMCLDDLSSDVDILYLYYFLQNYDFRSVISGTTIPQVTKQGLEKIDVVVSSKENQREIVRQLQLLDSIIEERHKELRYFDALIKSRFIEMFGDPKINPNNYPVCQLSDFIVFLTSGSRGWAQYCADDGTEWFITIKNVKDCHIETDNMQPINAPDNAEAKRTRAQEGDLLISITADLGRTGVVTKEIAEHGAYINQHLTCIRLKQDVLNPLYVAYFMESPAGKEQFESKNQSAVKAGLNFNSINSLRLMIPPLDDQNAFVDFIKQTDKSKYHGEFTCEMEVAA